MTRPTDEVLRSVLDAYAEVLGTSIGPHEDFFGHGGHSLLVIRLIALLKTRHGLRVSARQFLVDATPVAVAAACLPVDASDAPGEGVTP
ncbi:acyl carrier protein [Streptomyces sp. NPDC094447]|uniref:acyl carrier protein n=1 Tax=Streptomyces sp. NPDC094447 TaxID=3366062 RepID=UPI0037FF4356